MKESILTISLLILVISGFSQKITESLELKGKKEYNDGEDVSRSLFFANDENGTYALELEKSGGFFNDSHTPYISLFDKNFERLKRNALDFTYKDYDRSIENIIHLNNKIYFISSFYNKKEEKTFVFLEEIDKKTLKTKGEIRKIAEIDFNNLKQKKPGIYNKTLNNDDINEFDAGNTACNNMINIGTLINEASGNFDFRISRDGSKVLMYYAYNLKDKKTDRYKLHVFDKSMNLLWDMSIESKTKEELCEIMDYELSNTGTVFVLKKLYNKKKTEERKNNPNYVYELASYNGNKSGTIQAEIKTENFIPELEIALNDKDKLFCAGYFGSESDIIEGTVFMKPNPNNLEIESKKFNKLKYEFVTKYQSKKEKRINKRNHKKRKPLDFGHYKIKHIITTEDRLTIIGEEFYSSMQPTSYSDNQLAWVSECISITSYSYDGNINYNSKIPKKTLFTRKDAFNNTYSTIQKGNDIYFIYYDNVKNHKDIKKAHKAIDCTTIARVNSDGKLKREKLATGLRKLTIFGKIGNTSQFNNNAFFNSGYYDEPNPKSIVKIEFE